MERFNLVGVHMGKGGNTWARGKFELQKPMYVYVLQPAEPKHLSTMLDFPLLALVVFIRTQRLQQRSLLSPQIFPPDWWTVVSVSLEGCRIRILWSFLSNSQHPSPFFLVPENLATCPPSADVSGNIHLHNQCLPICLTWAQQTPILNQNKQKHKQHYTQHFGLIKVPYSWPSWPWKTTQDCFPGWSVMAAL